MSSKSQEATSALAAHTGGDPSAASRLLPLVYDELRSLASGLMRKERPGHTLSPTALVHEAYVRLIDNSRIDWKGKTHFFAIAAKEMRQVLVRHALNRKARKRGGDATRVTLDDEAAVTEEHTIDVVALNEALTRLEALSPRQSRVVELRTFAGLSVAETALVLGVSERTIKGDWRAARAFLARELTPSGMP
jgi:RNA polymerase sigma factor (TIGR02999 family)